MLSDLKRFGNAKQRSDDVQCRVACANADHNPQQGACSNRRDTPSCQSALHVCSAGFRSPDTQFSRISRMRSGCGWSHTLYTLASVTMPKPAYVDCTTHTQSHKIHIITQNTHATQGLTPTAQNTHTHTHTITQNTHATQGLWLHRGTCRLFNACRMSPSAVNTIASRPSGVRGTCSTHNEGRKQQPLETATRQCKQRERTFSLAHTSTTRDNTCSSVSFTNRNMAQRLCSIHIMFTQACNTQKQELAPEWAR